jgi:ankyrin repeat protein
MTKQLPSRASLEQLKKQAKSLLKGYRALDPNVLKLVREHHPRWRNSLETATRNARFALADAQLVIAHEYGFETWSKMKAHVELHEMTPSNEVGSLHEAARRGDLARLNALLDAFPEMVDETAGPGVRTALHVAVGGTQEEAVKLLLERGANPNIRCEGDNAYPLHFAAEKQHLGIIRLLIEHGADPIGEDDYHELGVMGWATAWDYVTASREVVDYLTAHGARHNIFSAVAMGEVNVIGELVSRSGADLEKRMDLTNRRRRPLHLAVVKKQPASLRTLLDLGANIEALDEAGFTALDQAALGGETESAQILLKRGARVRLPAAVALERTPDIEKLLGKDPDCLKPSGRWGNLIVRASERASGLVLETLIRAGASVNVRDDPKTSVDSTSGYTPLHAAAFHGNLSAVSVLLKYGADVRARDEKYRGTPAGWANYNGHRHVGDVIRRGPVDIMEAVEAGLTDRVLAILQEDADALNRPFREYALYPLYAEGWYTPLVFAVALGQTDVVPLLLKHGADRTVCSPEGRTLCDIAEEKGHQNIVDLLKTHAIGQRG